jgi:pimeloyl-ACP methyl ester carboxylesterase
VALGISNCPSVRVRADVEALRWQLISGYCRVLLYDRRGIGSSSVPEAGYSPKSCVDDVLVVLDDAGLEKAVLWGAVDGGPLAMEIAAEHPGRVAGLLLLGTTPKPVATEDFELGINPNVLRQFLQLDPVDQARAATEITGARRAAADALMISEVMRRVPRQAWSKIVGSIGRMDAREMLARITAPTLIIHDPENTYIPAGAARYLHERIARSELYLTDEFGSPLFGDALHERISAFIRGVVPEEVRN